MKTIKINSLVNHLVIVVTDNKSTEEITQQITSALLKSIDSVEPPDKEKIDGSPKPQATY